MIKTQILVKNNEKTIKKTLESIKALDSKIVVANLKSTDDTIKICLDYGADVVEIDNIKDYSKIRNSLCSNEYLNFYIKPWEKLVQGHNFIKELNETTNLYVFYNNLISKEIRIWKNEKFKNEHNIKMINSKTIAKYSSTKKKT